MSRRLNAHRRIDGRTRSHLRARRRSVALSPVLERLETRRVLSSFTVTKTADSGPGSLRQAILDANKSGEFATITFNIGSGVQTITPLSPLPSVIVPVVIDGSPPVAFSGQVIELDGSAAGACNGLDIEGGSSTVSDLVIHGFAANNPINGIGGILLGAGGHDLVTGCNIGTDVTGEKAQPNDSGIEIENSPADTIGGTGLGQGNVISGNSFWGVAISDAGSVGVVVEGNLIGTDVTGTKALGNQVGVLVTNTIGQTTFASASTIGGNVTGAGNTIAGNGDDGIELFHAGSNLILGNRLGTTADGTQPLGNGHTGILVFESGSNTIGGTDPGAGNLISGNGGGNSLSTGSLADAGGISFVGGAADNLLLGNLIGTDVTGASSIANVPTGVLMKVNDSNVSSGGPIGNTIGGTDVSGRNVISGNAGDGIRVNAGSGNLIQGDWIGIVSTSTGDAPLGNGGDGVTIVNSSGNTVGSGNVISANTGNGVSIEGQAASGNHVIGNMIGTTSDGLSARGNGAVGIVIDGAPGNVIGDFGLGSTGGSNLISANKTGVLVTGSGATQNLVQANLIGTNVNGTVAPLTGGLPIGNAGDGIDIENAPANTVGGAGTNLGNVISNNGSAGIAISGQGANHTTVQSNLIGTDMAGTSAVPNAGDGILLSDALNDTIGSTQPGQGNVIAANGGCGIHLVSADTNLNTVVGNDIGVAFDGVSPLGNGADGIFLDDAGNNSIGAGTLDAAGNLQGANVIGANVLEGIRIQGTDATHNRITGNFIGTDASVSADLGNGSGGIFIKDADHNTIGGTGTHDNRSSGVSSSPAGNTIANNGATLKRRGFGVVVVTGTSNSIEQNSIYNNAGRAISLGNGTFNLNDVGDADTGPNNLQNYPVVRSLDVGPAGSAALVYHFTFNSAPSQTYTIDVYDNTAPDVSGYGGEENFEYSLQVTTDAKGNATFDVAETTTQQYIATTATDSQGNTSECSMVDSDADGLADAWELWGIDPNDQSKPGDGSFRYLLPGANPFHKDVYVEIDAMTGQAPLPDNTLVAALGGLTTAGGLATGTDLDHVVQAFGNAPQSLVQNPDGSGGINLHLQIDETFIPDVPWTGDFNGDGKTGLQGDAADQDGWPYFYQLKAGQGPLGIGGFGTLAERTDPTGLPLKAKALAYRYCVFADQFASTVKGTITTGVSGISEGADPFGGNDFMVTLGGWPAVPAGLPYGRAEQQEGTFMHELGHTLGLGHGGQDDVNYKPNYFSVMNYLWQTPKTWMYESFAGIDYNLNGTTTDVAWNLDYSEKAYPTVNEVALSETASLGGPAGMWVEFPPNSGSTILAGPLPPGYFIDWNGNGVSDAGTVTADINGDGVTGVLVGYDDWSHLNYDFLQSPYFTIQATAENDGSQNDGETFEDWEAASGLLPPPTDPGTLALSATSYEVNERAGTISIGVLRQGGTVGPVSIQYATSAGTARPGSDYRNVSGVLSFVAGQLSGTIVVPILNNPLPQGSVTFTIALSNPAGGAVLGAQTTATVTIDNDQRPIPQTYLVTNEEDNGPGSLRQAILDANAHFGTDTIAFALGNGTVLVPRSPLPPITDPVIIDGTTSPGYAGTPVIQITGMLAGDNATGLDIEGGHSTIKGLVLDDFQTGLVLNGGDNAVIGDWIGPNAYGLADLANLGTGIEVPAGSSGNTIGGATASDANILSDNQETGLEIDGSRNQIQGNWIGLDPTGLAALPNGTGVVVAGAGNTIGGANVISGNYGDGIDITGTGATANVAQGNLIGPEATGGGPLPNGGDGVLVENRAARNLIGGSTAGAGNTITDNRNSGIHLASGSTTTQVLGNTIASIGNEEEDEVGGPGVLIEDSSHNVIGTTSAGAGNQITSDNSCVAILSGTGDSVRGNAIFQLPGPEFQAVGIDLGWNGFTPNHSGSRSGPNNFQNFPTISSVTLGGAGVVIQGDLNSKANTTYQVDLYTSKSSTQSGEVYMTTVTVTTDATGQAHFSTSLPTSALAGYYVTATATDPGSNTSELSSSFMLDTDADSIPDWEEAEAGNNGDANGDGIPDRFQPNVASFGGLITFAAPAGTQFSQVGFGPFPVPPNPPGRAVVSQGLFTWTLSGLASGASTRVQVIVPSFFDFNTYYRYGPTADNPTPHWDTFTFDGTTGGQVTGPQTITLHIVDGGRGDDDMTPNGVIKEVGAPVDGPETYRVTNTNDSGPGSLRQAILDSNAHPPLDTIAFAIDSGPQVIAPLHILPTITDSVVIDGTTQPGYAGTPLIALSGAADQDYTNVTNITTLPAFYGLHITAGITTVRGLDINSYGKRSFPIGNSGFVGTVIGTALFLDGGSDNLIVGDEIGTDLSGTLAAPNGWGIQIFGSSDNTIGGSTAQNRNIISGNLNSAIVIFASSDTGAPPSAGNLIEGNFLGSQADGVSPLGNGLGLGDFSGAGVLVNQPEAPNTTIGGPAAGAGNVIAFNGGAGVFVNEAPGTSILGNSIYGNASIGIEDGFPADGSLGDSLYQIGGSRNYPILSSAAYSGSQTVIQGRLNTRPNEMYRIEFFSSAIIDPSGFGGGQTFLGAISVTTDATGNVAFTATLPTFDPTERFVTATATDPQGNTSQFSARLAIGDVLGSVFVVTTADDSDEGGIDPAHMSLREAILAANQHPGLDTIEFDIPGGGVHTITPRFDLPAIIDPVIIDATTQPGYAGSPLVVLTGTLQVSFANDTINYGPSDTGLRLLVGDSTVRGLVLNGFEYGIAAYGSAGGTAIQACYLGTDATGTQTTVSGIGIFLSNQFGDTIGGTTARAGNLISSNLFGGIVVAGGSNNLIQGNLIGTNAAGTGELGNGGVDDAVLVASSGNTIGGTVPGARNVIASSGQANLQVGNGDLVEGNLIGTDITGTTRLGNATYGIMLEGDSTIGGTASGAGNVISGGGNAGIFDFGASGAVIEGNRIGTDITGSKPLGDWMGVFVFRGSSDSTIGGTVAGAGNTIAFSQVQGVNISGDQGITVIGNSIFGNGELGIDLGGDGVTLNHQGGGVSGPNNFQNFPVITAAVAGLTTHVTGTLNSLPNTTSTVSLYANPAADPSGYGQGQFYLGSALVHTDASGNASFALILPVATTAGEVVSATATDPNGDTSEFSQDVTLQAPGPLAHVVSVVTNHGAVQRSMVTSITITFSGVVTLSPGAIAVLRQGTWNPVGLVLKTSVVNQQTVVEVTFTGGGVIAGSVPDGRYNLTIAGTLVHDLAGDGLDGASSGREGSSYVGNDAFFRLFGDANGDGVVDNQDLALFQGAFNTKSADAGYLAYFDFDGNGVIDANDQTQFMKRYGKRI
jgi:hypothetical protein